MRTEGFGLELLEGLHPPYVLLEDRLNTDCPAKLYRNPLEIMSCDEPAAVEACFARIEAGLASGLCAAGFMSYELGYALEPRLVGLMPIHRTMPLAWFGLFEAAEPIDAETLDIAFAALGPPPPLEDLTAVHSRATHTDKVRQILNLIADGDLYQANLTFPMRFRYEGDPLALYGALRARQPVSHGGLAHMGGPAVLSVSPELWVDVAGGRATAKPMKGTAPRHQNEDTDAAAAALLLSDPKQRAENLMIVDLLRNDLSRISRPGSVKAPALFTLESYPSFHALTSTVTSVLDPVSLKTKVSALFPCGSIVGAPKIRAGEVIRSLEPEPRGVYTGALGAISANGDMCFNVAIRTAVIAENGDGSYGVGGGIVADSNPDAEYDEALLKAHVIADLAENYGLIETFRWSVTDGFVRLPLHLERLSRSAAQLGFALDLPDLEYRIDNVAATLALTGRDHRCRVCLSRTGDATLTVEPLAAAATIPLRVAVAGTRLDQGDPFLRHKTTRRGVYEAAFANGQAAGWDEVLFLNQRGHVCEASRHTVFAEIEGTLITPPISCGLLPGVLRRRLLEDGEVLEGELTLETLAAADRWFLGNSLHGLRLAHMALEPPSEIRGCRPSALCRGGQ